MDSKLPNIPCADWEIKVSKVKMANLRHVLRIIQSQEKIAHLVYAGYARKVVDANRLDNALQLEYPVQIIFFVPNHDDQPEFSFHKVWELKN